MKPVDITCQKQCPGDQDRDVVGEHHVVHHAAVDDHAQPVLEVFISIRN